MHPGADVCTDRLVNEKPDLRFNRSCLQSCRGTDSASVRTMPDREPPDENQQVADLLAKATGTPIPNGEDLLGDPELQRQLREAKERLKKASGEN